MKGFEVEIRSQNSKFKSKNRTSKGNSNNYQPAFLTFEF